jgi:glycerophosphoryl diester phosphodiesterase
MPKVLNVAHRGARSLAPENTLAAARAGLQAGADMWELDVQLTSDDQLIVLHDSELTRTSDAAQQFPDRRPWRVADFTLAEVNTLDCGSWYNTADPFDQIASGRIDATAQGSYRGEKAPTLRQALEFTLANDWRANVELKDVKDPVKGQLLVDRTAGLIRSLAVEDRVLVSSFNHDYLRAVRALNPRIAVAALSVWAIRRPMRYLAGLEAQAYNPRRQTVRKRTVQSLRAAGLDIYVWTVNDVRSMRRLIDLGVTGIITDYPQILSALLREQ